MDPEGTDGTYYLQLYDGFTPQCCIGIMNNGSVQLFRGDFMSGTLLAVFPDAFIYPETWTSFEFEITIHPTLGSFAVRVNGSAVNNFTRTSMNTRATANSYANAFGILAYSSWYDALIDDFLWRSGTTVPWVGDARCFTRFPAYSENTQFTKVGETDQYTNGGGYDADAVANLAYYSYAVMEGGGTVTVVSFSPGYIGTDFPGTVKLALFADNNGAPGEVLGAAIPINGIVAPGPWTDFIFSPPVVVVTGQKVWIGIVTDMAWEAFYSLYSILDDPEDPTLVGWIGTDPPFTSFPGTPGGLSPSPDGVNYFVITIVLDSASCLGDPNTDAGWGYVIASAPGTADLYPPAQIGSALTNVLGVTTRGYMRKTDAGTKTACMQLISGTTTVQTPTIVLGAGDNYDNAGNNREGYTWTWRTDVTNPATGAAWTWQEVDALLFGPLIVS